MTLDADQRAIACYAADVSELKVARQTAMRGVVWHEHCPIALEQLVLLTVTHWNFAQQPTTGQIVVHRGQADALVRVFEQLFCVRYPIERMQPIEAYGGDDLRSMAANNSSGFNGRRVMRRPEVWSQHAYGLAIDLNPVQNPYLDDGAVWPPEGADFIDRSRAHPAMIRPDDAVVRAFASAGWSWGGHWDPDKDYQHFSANHR